jgi:hypothetical protein
MESGQVEPDGRGATCLRRECATVVELDSGFRSEIHPDDLQFGVMVRGWVVATVGAVKSRTLFAREFKPLAADPDGSVRFDFTVEDAIGGRAVVLSPCV